MNAAAKNIHVRTEEKIRILIADEDRQSNRRTMEFFTANGFDCRTCTSATELKKLLTTWVPRVLIVDLLLPDANALEILDYFQRDNHLKNQNISVIVLSGHNSENNVREAFQRGASDYLARPVDAKDLLRRVIIHCRSVRTTTISEEVNKFDSLAAVNLFLDQALQKGKMEDILFNLTKMAAIKVKGARCSIVYLVTNNNGKVLASSDKKNIAGLNLDLKKYPEIQLTVNTGKTIVIDDLNESRALSQIKTHFKDIQFNAMIICPIRYHNQIIGVISMRMPPPKNIEPKKSNDSKPSELKTSEANDPTSGRLVDRDIHFMEFAAKVISLYLSTQKHEELSKYGLLNLPTDAI
jgi:DNA-binding response OmpR family regulator